MDYVVKFADRFDPVRLIEYRRQSERTYTHASRDANGVVRFHGTATAAQRAAGKHGEVMPIRTEGRECVVCEGTGTVTYGPSATDRTMNTVTCHRCGG